MIQSELEYQTLWKSSDVTRAGIGWLIMAISEITSASYEW